MRPVRLAPSVVAAAVALSAAAGGAAMNLHLLEPRSRANAPLLVDHATSVGTTPAGVDPPGGAPADQPGDTTTTVTVPGGGPTTSVAPEGTTPPPTTSSVTPPPPTASPPPPSSRTYSVGTAGSVVLSVTGGRLTVDAIRPAGGWTYVVDRQTTEEVEITFRSGEQETGLHGQLEGGQLVVEIEGSSEPPDD